MDEWRAHFQLFHVATEPTFPVCIWTGSLVVERMPVKGIVVSSSLAKYVGLPLGLLTIQRALHRINLKQQFFSP